MHVSEKCERKSCDIKSCNLRHPKICRYFRDRKFCKFGEWCCFEHKNSEEDFKRVFEKCNIIENKVNNLEILLIDKDQVVNTLGTKIEKKVEAFEINLKTLKECIAEKDAQIEALERKLNEMELRLKSEEGIEKDKLHLEKPGKPEPVKCNQCDFETNSKHGLKIHTARKHTLINENSSLKCELCDQEFEKQKDLRKHLKSHSYIEARFKCVDCDFVGESNETMEVHVGKEHTNTFECGICNFEAQSHEDIEVHLFTCEIYKCYKCDCKERSINEIKKHTEKHHGSSGHNKLHHMKMDRNNKNEVCDKVYYFDEI